MLRTSVIPSVALAVTFASGLLSGVWSDRWGPRQSEEAAVARLELIPKAVGTWDGTVTDPDERDYPKALIGPGKYVRYVDRVSGDVVTVFFNYCPPGPSTVHTPPLCFNGNGRALVGTPERHEVRLGGQGD